MGTCGPFHAVAGAAVLAFGASVGWAAEALLDERIGVGDEVRFHFSAYDENGTLVYTSDPAVAQAALEAGNPHVDPNLTARRYSQRTGVVLLDSDGDHVSVSPWLLGRRAGEIVATPFIKAPLGIAETFELPAQFGPYATSFTMNVTELEAHLAARTTARNAAGFLPGTTVPFDVVEAEIVWVEGENVDLTLLLSGPTTIHSARLGFNLTLEAAGENRVILRPVLAVGDVFTTAGCDLPVRDLPPGTYRVVVSDEHGVTLTEAPPFTENALGKTLRLEITILSFRRNPGLPFNQ